MKGQTKGAVLVVTAALVPLIMLLCILMVDVGVAYAAKSHVEHVAIEAAEAAEKKLPDAALAQDFAERLSEDLLASMAPYSESHTISSSSDSLSVTVEISATAKTFFAPIFGVNGIVVRAAATRPLP